MKRFVILGVLFLASHISVTALPSEAKVKMLTLSGRVLNDDSQAPVISKLTVNIEGFEPVDVSTNNKGEFSLYIPAAAEYKVKARAKGFESQEDVIVNPDFEEGIASYVEIRLTPFVKLTLDGSIFSAKDRRPLDGEVSVYYCSDFIREKANPVRAGKFSASLIHFGYYMIDVHAPGYQSVLDTLWITNYNRKNIHKDYYLPPIEPGLTLPINNLKFTFDKATLTRDSYPALDDVARILYRNPDLQVEVAGHTDNDGDDNYNLFLSQLRAQAVVNYLVARGIPATQLTAKGYGETKPIESNATKNGKSINRRVELIVVK
jgi:OOP family OmpA-OmpF porin